MPGVDYESQKLTAAKKLPELAFGAKSVVEAVNERIERHFANLDAGDHEDPLVVGLFGEWGSGKTLWLKHIEQYFKAKLDADLESGSAPSITVPVFFNAWRYEKEEHLIYPLVKVLEIGLRALLAEAGKAEEAKSERGPSSETGIRGVRSRILSGISRAWQKARRAVVAAGMGLAGLTSGITIRGEVNSSQSELLKVLSGISVEGKLGIELSGKGIVDFLTAAKETQETTGKKGEDRKGSGADDAGETRRDDDLLSFAERVRSDYYDFQRILRELTGRDGADGSGEEGTRVNLLFLIDDLDRCLPEKAVEMLEAIKLFMEVEGAAFVLALDDEVVERGIVHRYRDYTALQHPTAWDSIAYSVSNERYREFLDLYTNHVDQPITGHEYLEKIVHLQVRLPRVEADDVGAYLTRRYPWLFTRKLEVKAERVAELGGLNVDKEMQEAVDGGRQVEPRKQHIVLFREQLIGLFTVAVPPVPRKLIRAAELLDLKTRTAGKNGWNIMDNEEELYVLAQFTLVQLFAPELYRFAQREFPHFLGKMVKWLDSSKGAGSLPSSFCLEELERRYRSLLTKAKDARPGENQDNGASEKGQEGGFDGSGLCTQEPVVNLTPRLVESKELPLLDYLIRARQKRSGFDPFNVVLNAPNGVYDGVRFSAFFSLRRRAEMDDEIMEQLGGEPVELVPRDAEMFINQVTAPDGVYWRNALEDEGVAGKRGRLRDDVFTSILNNLPNFGNDAVKMLDWLETLESVLSPDQFNELAKQLGVFSTLKTTGASNAGGEGGE